MSASGSLVASTRYDPWGNPETPGGLASETPIGFAGGYTDSTGLVYLIHRYYDPSTGQFLNVDPLVNQTQQPYQYAGDDPVNNSDPSGLCTSLFNIVCVGGGWVGKTISFRFDPGAAANATVNIGRGASFGLSDKIANWISPGASCTVAGNGIDEAIGAAATTVVLGGTPAAEEEGGAAADDAADVTFGHGARHLVGTGLDQGDVESAIESQVSGSVTGADSTGSFWGRVAVNNQTIEYRAYTLPNGSINVGTYDVVP